MPTRDVALALDIGGTKLAGALVDAGGIVHVRRVRPTEGLRDADGDRLWGTLLGLVKEVLDAAGAAEVVGIGVGSAGPLDPIHGTVSPVNIPAWRCFPLADRLADSAPALPVRLAGDGICMAVGEHWQGAARGVDDVLAIVVSTGVGGGLILSGRLHAGRSGNAGHIGHVVVDMDGDPCACGGMGCVEAVASGPSMVAWARRNGWRPAGTVGDAAAAEVSAVDLAAAARAGEPVALAAFERAGRALAAGVASAAALCDLSHTVIGGGVARSADVLFPPLLAAFARYGRLGFIRDVRFETAKLGGAAGLVGAAALVFEPDRYSGRDVVCRSPSP